MNAESVFVAEQTTVSLATAALTMAAVEAGIPLAMGFGIAGVFGACVGHARWMLERERADQTAMVNLDLRIHICMMLRAVVMGMFTSFLLLLLWIEMRWPWTWGIIVASLASVFSADAIEGAWRIVKGRAERIFGK